MSLTRNIFNASWESLVTGKVRKYISGTKMFPEDIAESAYNVRHIMRLFSLLILRTWSKLWHLWLVFLLRKKEKFVGWKGPWRIKREKITPETGCYHLSSDFDRQRHLKDFIKTAFIFRLPENIQTGRLIWDFLVVFVWNAEKKMSKSDRRKSIFRRNWVVLIRHVSV